MGRPGQYCHRCSCQVCDANNQDVMVFSHVIDICELCTKAHTTARFRYGSRWFVLDLHVCSQFMLFTLNFHWFVLALRWLTLNSRRFMLGSHRFVLVCAYVILLHIGICSICTESHIFVLNSQRIRSSPFA